MNVAVLCPGPSLPRYWRPSLKHDVVIGVNTAGWKYRVDWLAFSDRHVLEGLEFMPRIGFITHGNHAIPADKQRLDPLLYDARSNALTAELHALAARQGMTECAWTFPNALAQANRFAQDGGEVHVFGFDCAEVEKDFAGQEGEHGRRRWELELPWIKSQWTPQTVAFGEASPEVIAYVRGQVANSGLTLEKLMKAKAIMDEAEGHP
jgi:hypothetical protein